MTQAFVSPLAATKSHGLFAGSSITAARGICATRVGTRTSTRPNGVRVRTGAVRMISEPPTPNDGDSAESEAGSNEQKAPSQGEQSSSSEAMAMTGVENIDDVLNTIPNLSDGDMGSSGEFSLDGLAAGAGAAGAAGDITVDMDDDLKDVEVLEELQIPQPIINAQAIKEARIQFRTHEKDTGSPEYQIATLTRKIQYMTTHLKEHPKDYASTRGLLKMVSKRTRLLKYVRRLSQDRFHNIIAGLNIRVSQQLRRLGE